MCNPQWRKGLVDSAGSGVEYGTEHATDQSEEEQGNKITVVRKKWQHNIQQKLSDATSKLSAAQAMNRGRQGRKLSLIIFACFIILNDPVGMHHGEKEN